MSRVMRVLAAVSVLALVVGGGAWGIRKYLSKEYSDGKCGPCSDLNTCQPLELSLEISKPWPRVNRTYTLWHKVRLTNSSCLRIPSFNVLDIRTSGFEGTTYNRLNQRWLYFKVWNDRDQEIAPYTISRPTFSPVLGRGHYDDELRIWEESGLEKAIATRGGRESEFGKVYPYRLAPSKTDTSPGLDVDNQGFTTLVPGSWAASAPSILAPYIEKVTLYDVIDPRGIGTGTRRELIPVAAPPGAQVPPQGFQILRGYRFDKPGKYRIAAFYQTEPSLSTVERGYPRFEALPGWMKRLVQKIALIGIDVRPRTRLQRPLVAQSPEVTFEVLPR